MNLGPRGLFETLEDGTIIYYGRMGWNKPGYIVDEATMRAIQRLTAASTGTAILTIPALFRAGFLWLSLALGILLVAVTHVQHKKLVKDLPVSTLHCTPGFRRRFVLISVDMSYFVPVLCLIFVCPALAWIGWSSPDDPDTKPILSWAALAGGALGWLFSAAMLSVKVTMSVRRVRAWLKDRRK
ncbi:MAG: hypothetical protein J0I68_24275 [Achromobacter sp.]|jgi:hypothetical protein|uniref:Uncharacterized protein n=1 Tax=Achromobacter insuavis TaxID=1287735 RepID=A0A6J4ZU97_9BURK|nr:MULTISPECIES: hypothetical protein [Achromobacter]MBN9641677.1 hypothetical protein [Achromobacter sp.]CAB3634134.1 hypothetical protein LMG26845_01375 [Achromobacter insuavis]CUI57168.1 Uncharacterised protein [Achromobacter sp. 2789STDY5608633]CUJ75712.1 Uncharacterised protein [Achromobacter sp. 2789STDY5608628]